MLTLKSFSRRKNFLQHLRKEIFELCPVSFSVKLREVIVTFTESLVVSRCNLNGISVGTLFLFSEVLLSDSATLGFSSDG